MITVQRRAWDIDAAAHCRAGGICGFNEQRSIHHEAVGFKTNNVWKNTLAIYPMTGSFYAMGLNLKNPINSNLAYRITWSLYPTFSPRGVDFNGTTQYGDTFFIPSTLTANNTHLSYYSRENVQSGTDIGEYDQPSDAINFQMLIRYTDNNNYTDAYAASGGRITYSHTDSSGFWLQSRTASNAMNLYKNGSSVASIATSGGSLSSSVSINIGRSNSNAPLYSSRQCAFASIGPGFIAAQVFAMNQIVQQAQMINHGRQV